MATKVKRQKTYLPSIKEFKRVYIQINADGLPLGRLASEIAKILLGKHKPTYTPHQDCGDGVIVVNAGKVAVTGSKAAQKIYYYHTGAMSGLRQVPYEVMKQRKPTYMLEQAVKKMMPKTRLGEQQFKKLHLFAGEEHDMAAQAPIEVNI